MQFRHENKYMISESGMYGLLAKARLVLKSDPHADAEGKYHIRSLYFDDFKNTCYYENENGIDPRAKYRIRYYNSDTDNLFLEKKIKYRGLTHKDVCRLSREECRLMMKGIMPSVTGDMDEVKKIILLEMRQKLMKPKVIVSYDRIPLVYPVGNVRTTFDYNISASGAVMGFLDGNFPKRPVLSSQNLILEIKWDETFPKAVKDVFDSDRLAKTSFSKYSVCRKFSTNGGIV